MSYDYNADNDLVLPNGIKYRNYSPFDIAKRDIEYFVDRGVWAGKIVLGIPFYGRPEFSQNFVQEVKNFSNALAETQIVGGVTYYFNGFAILDRKIQMAKEKNIGGFMFWSIYSDKMMNYNTSTLKYIVDRQ